MKNLIFLILSIILIGNYSMAKPREVDLKRELKYAKFVGIVEIQSYSFEKDSLSSMIRNGKRRIVKELRMKSIGNDSVFTSFVINSKGLLPIYRTIDYHTRNTYTSFWPSKGDTVLVVIDSLNRISVFGIETGNYYRIWSPYNSGSLAAFIIKDPIESLSQEANQCFEFYYGISCWDGCLLPIESIQNRRTFVIE